ncbi:hypothetical protein GA0074696_3409 [Micromonospora purpureochromogenes]|uniref:Uncharacterized protein n=2 Tax=Micromonospora purpureochromogenes TaxID=47872 RepID=A0A1C4YIF0_9ACTN|nr:hypothetical protein GA0074696_3409 [Micromonospora purpureochromogenes]
MQSMRIWRNRRPFENAVLVTAPVCGLLLITLNVRPPSVEMAMPHPIRIGWELGLILVGLGGLLGLTWPGRISTALGIELASMLLLGTLAGMYSVALLVMSGRMAVAAASFITAVAVGSWWRATEILLDLRRLIRSIDVDTGNCPTGGRR